MLTVCISLGILLAFGNQELISSVQADLKEGIYESMDEIQAEKQELLMGALSHEMRTPLTSIIGYSNTLRHVKLKDEQKDRALEHINREGKRLEALSGKMMQLLGLYQNNAIKMEMTPASQL